MIRRASPTASPGGFTSRPADAQTRPGYDALVDATILMETLLEHPPKSSWKAHFVKLEKQYREHALRLLRHVQRGSTASAALLGESQGQLADTRIRLLKNAPQPGIGKTRLKRRRELAEESVDDLLHEIGLESLDAVVHTGRSTSDGALVFAWEDVSGEAAHVWLLDHLYEILEAFVVMSELLTHERSASAWYFSRLTADTGHSMDHAYTAMHRESEWSLIERPTIAFGESVLALVLKTELLPEVGPRLLRMAEALTRSRAGLFTVIRRDGADVHLRDLESGATLRLHEHSTSLPYTSGAVAVGRIFPFTNDVYLRTPGMLFFDPADDGHGEAIASLLGQLDDEGFPRAVAIEGAITIALLGQRPRPDVPPAASKAAARSMLYELFTQLDVAGLADHVPTARQTPEFRKMAASPGREVFGALLDPVMAEWVQALSTCAGISNPTSDPGRGKKRRKGSR